MNARDWIPAEWRSAWSSALELLTAVNSTENTARKQFVGLFLPLVIGAGAHWAIARSSGTPGDDAMRALLTFAAIVSGFMITLLLFTGKGEQTQDLTVEESRVYIAKVRQLLHSQVATLLAHLLTALFVVAWFALSNEFRPVMSTIAFAFAALSVSRTILIPMQIYELHAFGLQAILDRRIRAEKDAIEKQRQADIRSLTDVTRP